MENLDLYLCKTGKSQRTRIKISITHSIATAILVSCYEPTPTHSFFRWEIKKLSWHFEDDDQRQAYFQFISGCQKEEKRFFKIAHTDALEYKRNASQPPGRGRKLKGNKIDNKYASLTKEQVLNKILQSTRKL